MFCKKCGKQIPDDSNACQYCGAMLTEKLVNNTYNQVHTDCKAQPKENKKTPWKIIVPIVAVVVVLAILLSIVSCVNIKKNEDKKRLLEVLEASTDKPVVEFIHEDYDGDGTYEAYAVVGESEEKEDYTEYSDSDIYFVNQTEAEIIKESVSGHANGVIEVDNTIYVSLEVYEKDTEKGFSYIYSAEESKPVESDISGKYSDVHEERGKIIATDENGQKVEIEIITSENSEISGYLEATEEDWKNFNEFLTAACSYCKDYDRNSDDALETAYDFISGTEHYSFGSLIYFYFFGKEDVEFFASDGYDEYEDEWIYEINDPLNKICKRNYYYSKYTANKIDWIVENIFGLKPNRDISKDGFYYYGDYFYIGTGDGLPFDYPFETKHKRLSDGRYETTSTATFWESTEVVCVVNAIVGLKEVDGRRVWTISKFTVGEEQSTETDSAASYIGKTFGDVIDRYGADFITYYYEGGDFVYYKDMHPLITFGALKANEEHSADEIKDMPIKYMLAYEDAHVYKDFYANMSYNQLKKLVPGIDRPQASEMDDGYYISFTVDEYRFSYGWRHDEHDDDDKSVEVFISRSVN